ncbi:unnamed protein product [Effrenium voratum]|nr:unnamed protein product [Effrenium voratum]
MACRSGARSSRVLPRRKPTPLAPKLHPGTGLPLSRARGQHLLHNRGVLQKLIDAADIRASDSVFEVGCGTGELTTELLPRARKVYTIDLDERMAQETQSRAQASGFQNLEVVTGDALRVPLPRRFDVCVSNLPYKISAPIIFRLLRRISEGQPWRSAVLMLQKEFADRLLSDPGEKGFSRLALNVRLFARAVRLFDVSPGSFTPAPEVHSTVIRLEPRIPAPEVDFNEWDALIRVIFFRRRKTLRRQFTKLSTLSMLEQNYKMWCSLSGVKPSPTPFPQLVLEVLQDEAMLRERAFAMDLDDLHLLLKAFNKRGRQGRQDGTQKLLDAVKTIPAKELSRWQRQSLRSAIRLSVLDTQDVNASTAVLARRAKSWRQSGRQEAQKQPRFGVESLQVALKSTVWIIAKTQLAELRAVKPMAGGGNAMSTAKMLGRAVGVSLLTATALVAVQVLRIKRRRGPKGFKDFVATSVPRSAEEDCARDRFSAKKLPKNIEAIVIGSGIGGLYLAALLAKSGRVVVVLEQHYVAGGCTHEFTDKGWTFDTGVHYVGRAEKYGKLLELVSEDPIEFAKMGSDSDGYVYDQIKIGEEAIHSLRAGRQNFIEDLQRRFPEEKEAIERYVEMVVKCNKSADLHFFGKLFPRFLQRLLDPLLSAKFNKLASRTVKEVMDELFHSELLKAILCGQFGDYGMTPSSASFFIHAGIVSHYLDGGYYPVGGPQNISRGLIKTIEKAGGRVLVNAPVEKITVSLGRAAGLVLRNGAAVAAPLVVSAAGAEATAKLLPGVAPPERLEGGISHMYAFIGLKGSKEELQLTTSNLWALPSKDIEKDLQSYYADPWPFVDDGSMLLFVGFPSAKDPQADPQRSTCVIICEAKEEWFRDWKGEKQGRRGKDYEQVKRRFQDGMLKGLLKHFPQLEGRIEYVEMASPLSNRHYLNRAASYGLQHPPTRYTVKEGLRPGSNIEGLWLTGQDVTTNGFAGALMGGVVTAHGVLGYGFLELALCGRDLITDMMSVQ